MFDSSAGTRSSRPSIHGSRGRCRISCASDWPECILSPPQDHRQSPTQPPTASFICCFAALLLSFLYLFSSSQQSLSLLLYNSFVSSNPAASGSHAQHSFVTAELIVPPYCRLPNCSGREHWKCLVIVDYVSRSCSCWSAEQDLRRDAQGRREDQPAGAGPGLWHYYKGSTPFPTAFDADTPYSPDRHWRFPRGRFSHVSRTT